jgi:rapA
MLLGYISVAYPQVKDAKEHIRAIMKKHDFHGELKWTNVHKATYPMYKELIDYFFMTDLQFRVIVVDKSQIDKGRDDYNFEDFYFKMYFQLIHHMCNMNDHMCNMNHRYNLYIDIKDTCSHHKLRRLKDILANNTAIGTCQFVRSHEVVLLQLADVLMGAINYHLRVLRGCIEGKVIAKQKLVEEIQKHEDTPLEKSTSKEYQKLNRFFITLK